MAKELKEFKHYFSEKLKDLRYAIAYLNEALANEDKRVLLVALTNVCEAQKGNIKTKSFQKYLEKRLDKDEITEIERQALLEIDILQSMQNSISDAID